MFLLLGQRFTLDSYVFNNVTYDRVQDLQTGTKVTRMLPDELDEAKDGAGLHGTMGVLDGTVPREVTWHAYEAVLGAADVRLVMVCPLAAEAACRRLWSAVMTGVLQR